jgi:hypothetical protein
MIEAEQQQPSRAARRQRPRLVMPPPTAFAYDFDETRAMGGPSRSKCYEFEKEGKLRLIRCAGRTKVRGASLRRLLGVEPSTA